MSQPLEPDYDSPEVHDRRTWLRATIGVIVAAISSVLGIVAGGAVLSPSFTSRKDDAWVPAGRVRDLQDGVPVPVTLRVRRQDGYYDTVDQQVVFLIGSADGGVKALSSTCTHLGCRVSYDPDSKTIKCPCHGGVYTPDGKVIAGPPPRPLPELPARIDGSRVLVQV